MRLKKKLRFFLTGFFLLCLMVVGIAYYKLVYTILPYSPIRPHRITQNEISSHIPRGIDYDSLKSALKPYDVTVDDTIILKAIFIPSSFVQPSGTIILLHGIANCKESLLARALKLQLQGYNCIVYDSRAHGESGGINCTFGYYEKYDVSAVINQATKQFGDLEPIGIYGNSLGAAIALQAMANDNRIKCGIVESPFATLRETVYDYWLRMSSIPIHFIPNHALDNSEKIARFSVDDVNPEESAKHIIQPVLIVHGDNDTHISIEYSKRIFHNLLSTKKQFYEINGGTHYNLATVGGKKYQQLLLDFLSEHLKGSY